MLVIDNYDSFTYNIVQYLKILGINPIVIKNDELTLSQIKKLDFNRIIVSPGWGAPENSGVSMEVIDHYRDSMPILGICLGMQCIARYFGADIVRAPSPCHGKNSEIYFRPDFKLFQGFNQGFS
ncbi:anthranilate synthase component II, partial [Ruminobacter sp.]|uniref:anthranilate synthase component II n=1 Tax=Ruminobacter sp. TaxID=2774296 RepID=UPI00386EDE2D